MLCRVLCWGPGHLTSAIDGVFFNLQTVTACDTAVKQAASWDLRQEPDSSGQIKTANTVFRLTPIYRPARKVVAAGPSSMLKKRVLVVDDQLIEALHVRDPEDWSN
ncbi:MAG: hypothetical protein CM1200mP18_07170 [Gammaproteobacteria bacterium]|nr:MAG: hypothetical protein CM1200mP18_07170 [Gammaproteobacteria bacterium]